jgi:hypothetical protein
MSVDPQPGDEASEALEPADTDDFDADLGDARKAGHVAPILPPA